MKSKELRQKFLDFFKEKGHIEIPSASLIPENDPTVLFITAGMHPLVPYLLGEKHPSGKRLVGIQKCIRTTDINEVGDATHHTFFEMLGNWSLGDYFKKEAIERSLEFLTSSQWLNMDKNKISVSVFEGDSDAPFDEETYNIWLKLGIQKERIAKLPKKDNWWGLDKGPCGPDTEIFYNGVEIWNNVFMEYNKTDEGKFESLAQKNVDTGMGLERVLTVMNDLDDNYRTELFWPIIQKIEELSGKKYDDSPEIKRAMRIVADHIKASVFIIADGVEPLNTGQGYVLRRLIRRARYYFNVLTGGTLIEGKLIWPLVESVILIYKDIYKELNFEKIDKIIREEETTFAGHLMFGERFLEKVIKIENYISGENAFLLYATYGFPFELILDIAKERDIKVDIAGFEEKKKQHQELSRTASAGMFKGGLADMGEQTVKYHTATHLLLAALRQILGNHVFQKGSNITIERLRFDFSHPDKLTTEQIKQVEDLVNQKITENLSVNCEEMSIEEAKKQEAMGIFESKYGEWVKVYSIGSNSATAGPPFSREICGGPHVQLTGELGHFKIIKEEAVSAGVRRIKAILE